MDKLGCMNALTICHNRIDFHRSLRDTQSVYYKDCTRGGIKLYDVDVLDIINALGTVYFTGCDLVSIDNSMIDMILRKYNTRTLFKLMNRLCTRYCTMCFPNKDLWQGTPSTLSLIKDEVNTCFFDLESYKETPQGWELVLKRNGGIDEI